jgi:hypothetical protein
LCDGGAVEGGGEEVDGVEDEIDVGGVQVGFVRWGGRENSSAPLTFDLLTSKTVAPCEEPV